MIVVKYNKPGTYQFSVMDAGRKVTFIFGPGNNEISDGKMSDLWEYAKENVQGVKDRLAQTILQELPVSQAGTTKVKSFGDLNPQAQLNFVNDAYDLKLLNKWLGEAKDPLVVSKITKRINEVETKRKDIKDSENTKTEDDLDDDPVNPVGVKISGTSENSEADPPADPAPKKPGFADLSKDDQFALIDACESLDDLNAMQEAAEIPAVKQRITKRRAQLNDATGKE